MCLAIPGKVISITEENKGMKSGKVLFANILKEVNLAFVPEVVEGEYVLVHVGVAIGIISEIEAEKTLRYLEQINELEETS